MRYVFASDVHGSLFYAQRLMEIVQNEGAQKLILLGDLYYHGPRNPLPKDYNPLAVAELFNQSAARGELAVVRGNCDSEVDGMISTFKFRPSYALVAGGKRLVFTHGHKYNQKNPPKKEFDALIYGHEHIGFIREEGGKIFANTGSVSLPKNEIRSYLLLDGVTLYLKDFGGNVLAQHKL